VIQPIDTASSPAEKTAPPDKSLGGGHYASVHAAAAKPETTSPKLERVAVPEGETWAATKPGAHYAEIISGPRKGQFINLTHGDRRGETFTIDHRAGKTVHVYTMSGKEVLIKPAVDASATTDAAKHVKHPPADRPHKGERWGPVAGHQNYADILGGPRNGLFVNISGGVRDGMAFQILQKDGKVFHVYGTGKDRQMIDVTPNRHGEKSRHVSGTATDAASGTGGTSAPNS
jgi:hypothetical protein